MTPGEETTTSAGQAPSQAASIEIYERLAKAAPAERAEIVLALVEQSGRLVLPERDGHQAMLNEVPLGRVALRKKRRQLHEQGLPVPRWWDPKRKALNLHSANLQGASLSMACLEGAVLEEANLAESDLAGANLKRAALAEANLTDAMLEEANLQGAGLRFVQGHRAVLEGANLRGADLWGASLENAVLANANLRGAKLVEANLQGADLAGANLQGTALGKVNLQGARLLGADLHGASLTGANLRGANLRDAHMHNIVLTHTDITHVHVSGAWLDKTRLRQEQLGGAIGEELAGEFEEARKGYLALERNFAELGDPDAASWAYRKKRRMQKHEALRQARRARQDKRWREAAGAYARYGADVFVECLCDYGESIPRVFCSLLALYLIFIVLYGITGSVVRVRETPAGPVRAITHHPIDLAIFSLLAMSTSGSPAVGLLPSNELVHLLTASEALMTIALTGLMGFVIGNRIRR